MPRFKIPPFVPKHPKPKSKGKKPKTPAIKARPDIEPIDVFKATFSADAGAGSSSQAKETLEAYIKTSSKAELSKLERHINRVRRQVLNNKEDQKRQELACNEVSMAIIERFSKSALHESELCEEVHKTLSGIPITHLERSDSGNLKSVWIDKKKIDIRQFIHNYFQQELNLASKLLKDGSLITPHKQHGATAFVKHCINEYFE